MEQDWNSEFGSNKERKKTPGKEKKTFDKDLTKVRKRLSQEKDKSCPCKDSRETRIRYHPWLSGLQKKFSFDCFPDQVIIKLVAFALFEYKELFLFVLCFREESLKNIFCSGNDPPTLK